MKYKSGERLISTIIRVHVDEVKNEEALVLLVSIFKKSVGTRVCATNRRISFDLIFILPRWLAKTVSKTSRRLIILLFSTFHESLFFLQVPNWIPTPKNEVGQSFRSRTPLPHFFPNVNVAIGRISTL